MWVTCSSLRPFQGGELFGGSFTRGGVARRATTRRFHVELEEPVVFDCRMKPWYPDVLEVDTATRDLVDERWPEYGLGSA